MDMAMLQGAVTGLKTAADIAIGLGKLHTMAEVQSKAIELQQVILSAQSSALSAQSEQFSLVEKIRDLEKEVADIKAWETQKQRYKLVSPWSGTVVYAIQKQYSESEPPHWICTKCYEDGTKGFLSSKEISNHLVLECSKCKSQFQSHWRGGSISFKYAEEVIPQN
ncbi:MAG: hypothetical protein ACOY9D_12950 [Pseudomonadota bacterium]